MVHIKKISKRRHYPERKKDGKYKETERPMNREGAYCESQSTGEETKKGQSV